MPAEKLQTPQKIKISLVDFYFLNKIDGVDILKQLSEDEKAMALMDEGAREDVAMFVDLFEDEERYIKADSDEEVKEARAEWTVEVPPQLIDSIKEIMIKKGNNPSMVDSILKDFVSNASSLPVK